MAGKGLYAVLGIEEGVGLPTIRRAYRRLVFSVHPDVGASPDPERCHEIHEAYEILTDPEGRRSCIRAKAEPTYGGRTRGAHGTTTPWRCAARAPSESRTKTPLSSEMDRDRR